MRNYIVLFFLFSFASFAPAQKPVKKPIGAALNSSTARGGEREEFEKAVALPDAAERIKALQKFVAGFPKSAEKTRALELIVSARAQSADEKLGAGDAAGGIALFKLAVRDAPAPFSDRLFADVILQIPSNLFFRGERSAADETARAIEAKINGNTRHLIGLAAFYLGAENADQAKRLAAKALTLDANLPAAHQTLGLANRMNFNLEEAAAAYQKALALDADSVVSKRSLAEMKRALGQTDEAITLSREILDKNAGDALASNNLILSLFAAGKKAEAEAELQQSLVRNPNNLALLVGAAYSYAARSEAERAVEFGQRAVALEPRYVWGHIALARAYLLQNRFYDAESALLAARLHGNFPTLDYELATVRAAAGFYREAAQQLAQSFVVKNDSVTTKLGGRIEKQAASFTELVAFERRASVFEPLAADDAENARRLKSLLDFYQKLDVSGAASDAEISAAADAFLSGDDKMNLHRRLFVADALLEKRKSLVPKAGEMMKTAGADIDRALDIPNASAAVLADELYESRAVAIAKNQLIVVPEIARQTLTNVLRGRIEEISGAALLEAGKTGDAVVRLKRAVSVLPEKSAWWRSSLWLLGAALDADGKSGEALAAYVKSYTSEVVFDAKKRAVIESLYQKVNGNLDGLDAKIGTKIEPPANAAAAPEVKREKPDAAPKVSPAINEQTETKPSQNKRGNRTASKVPAKENKAKKTPSSLFEPVIITVPKTENAANASDKTAAGKCELTFSQQSVLLAVGGSLGILVGLDGDADASEIRAVSNSIGDVEAARESQVGGASNRAYFIFKSVGSKAGVFTVTFEAPLCGGKKEITVRVR